MEPSRSFSPGSQSPHQPKLRRLKFCRTLEEAESYLPEVPEPVVTPGDVDGDGVISLKDISLLKFYISEGSASDEIVAFNCDVDGDGIVNIKDISELKIKIAN